MPLEYKVLVFQTDCASASSLNQYAKDGWRVAQAYASPYSDGRRGWQDVIILEREAKPPRLSKIDELQNSLTFECDHTEIAVLNVLDFLLQREKE